MIIKLTQSFARNGKVDVYDTRQIKHALNRLGYYSPSPTIGMHGMPDDGVFTALKAFQSDHALPVTGQLKPDDQTIQALNAALSNALGGQYIWRSVDDDRVRADHAALNGTIQDWADSPDPTEEYNCRCWADFKGLNLDSLKEIPTGLQQEVISPINDAPKRWTDLEFVQHFFFGDGQKKALEEIGLLGPVIDHAKQIMFENVMAQVADRARLAKKGSFTGSWKNSYPFGEVVFSLGGAPIKGRFGGTVKQEKDILIVEAHAEYEFSDTFTDPLNKRQKKIGSSAPKDILYDFSKPWWNPGNLGAAYFAADTEYMGTPYEIHGKWVTKITGSILRNK